MAMRAHILAIRAIDDDTWSRGRQLWADSTEHRRGLNGEPLGGWWLATAPLWAMDAPAAEWLVSLLTRQSKDLGLLATASDDVEVKLCLQRNGRIVARLHLPYGGSATLCWDATVAILQQAELTWDRDQPLGAEARAAIQASLDDEGQDEWRDDQHEALLRALVAGDSPLQARAAVARDEVAVVADQLEAAGWPVDRDALLRVLDGSLLAALPAPEDDEDLPAWADVPELLAAIGLPGLRSWLLGQDIEDEDASPGVRQAEAPVPAPEERPRPGLLGVMGVAVVGGLVGSVLGSLGAGPVGAAAGSVFGFLLVFAVGLGLVRTKLRLLEHAVTGEVNEAQLALLDRMGALSDQQQSTTTQLLADWISLAPRVGIKEAPMGLLARFNPLLRASGNEHARRLAEGLLDGGDPATARKRLDKVRLAVLDAELAGRAAEGLRGELEAVSELVVKT